MAGANSEYCALLIILNSALQTVLFPALAMLFLADKAHSDASYITLTTSVAAFLVLPFAAAVITRFSLRAIFDPIWYDEKFSQWATVWSLISLLFTLFIIFASQGDQVLFQLLSFVNVATPLLLYLGITFFFMLLLTHRLGFGYKLSVMHSFMVTSNSFELAFVSAVATYGENSEQALASAVAPLIEVPVLLTLVRVVRWIGQNKYWEA